LNVNGCNVNGCNQVAFGNLVADLRVDYGT